MVKDKEAQFETVIGIKPSVTMMAKIHTLIEECVEQKLPELLEERFEEIVRKYLEKRERKAETKIIKLRKVPTEEASKLIKAYIDKHQGCSTSDIIYELALDPDLVLKILKKLEKDKTVRGESIESQPT